MTTTASDITNKPPVQQRGTFSKKFNMNYFVQDNITGSRGLTIWVAILTLITAGVLVSQFINAPVRGQLIFWVWAIAVLMTVVGELFTLHTPVSRWLKENMFTSVTNALVTLLLSLLVGIVVAGLWRWGVVNATIDPALTAPDVRTQDGASWGVLWGARKLILTGLLAPEHNGRVMAITAIILALWGMSFAGTRERFQNSTFWMWVRRVANVGWALSPFIAYIFLAGLDYQAPFINFGTLLTGTIVVVALMVVFWFFKVIQLNPLSIAMWVLAWPVAYLIWRSIGAWTVQSGYFLPIDVDQWGGLLLTMIFAVFVTILSFPIGVFLALGRRAEVQGIPRIFIWAVAIIGAIYFFATSTPELWTTSRNFIERMLALWPIILILAAFYFDSAFDGNFVQAFSVLFIELVRGVPLITLLFMAIIMAPFFAGPNIVDIKNFWAVIVGYTIFSSSYMAELVRGGLQAIPRGQYEAADALGFNTLQKYRFIVLPQALRILIPPLAGSVIGTFKSSSLVALVGMIDLVGATRAIIANNEWRGLRTELYVFMFVLYFVVSSLVSAYSRRLEERTGLGVR